MVLERYLPVLNDAWRQGQYEVRALRESLIANQSTVYQ